MTISRLLIIYLCAAGVSACGTAGPATTALTFEKESFDNYATDEEIFDDNTLANQQPIPLGCTVVVHRITDKRNRPNSFGTSDQFREFAKTVPQWVTNGLKQFTREKLVKTRQDAIHATISMDVDILKAYVHEYATAKNANIVLRITSSANNHSRTRIYRGMDTSINWNNSPDEVQEAMNAAYARLLTKLRSDLMQICRST